VGVPADSLVPAKGSLVSKGSTRHQLLYIQTQECIPAAGPKFVTPAVEAGAALGFFVVASTLGLVVAICQLLLPDARATAEHTCSAHQMFRRV
jgi:hypothetical protein